MANIHGLVLDPPAGFEADDVMVTLRAPPVDSLKDPRVLQKQRPVRANLIIHRRLVGSAVTLDMLSAEVCAQILAGIQGASNMENQTFAFSDGAAGRMVSFDYVIPMGSAKQFQALRLDAGIFTTLTLTVDGPGLNEAKKRDYFNSLASIQAPKT